MTAAYAGPDRRTVLAADAAGAHSQRKAAEEQTALAEDRLADARQQVLLLEAERDELHDLLRQIGDLAHAGSTGPAVPDSLWEIRCMAYDGIRSAS